MSPLVYPSFGQNAFCRLVNLSSLPFTFLTCVFSEGFSKVRLPRLGASFTIDFVLPVAFSIFVSFSITTARSEEHTSELKSLMRISYAVFCLKQKNKDCNDRL